MRLYGCELLIQYSQYHSLYVTKFPRGSQHTQQGLYPALISLNLIKITLVQSSTNKSQLKPSQLTGCIAGMDRALE